MPNNLHGAIRASVRALEEMVAPAIDPSNPLAREQAQLIIRTLQFIDLRLDDIAARDRAELALQCSLGDRILEAAGVADRDAMAGLEELVAVGRRLTADGAAELETVRRQAGLIAAAISFLVRSLDGTAVGDRVEAVVVSGSKSILELNRSWFLPTGFEADPASVPPLHEVLSLAIMNTPTEVAAQ